MGEEMMSANEAGTQRVLGEILGELRGIRSQMESNQEATNRRIDDLKASVDTRINGLTDRVEVVEAGQAKLLTKTASLGGVAGGLVSGVIELIKWKVGG